ncbi:hypothetical protein VTK73DRAFT_2826 [Phialemonium thermophilum]|uniref:Uncharacterized protein n=1 Tax=Phialemonium thermophilum TaxID=223376 RepID=A0ABR3X298_9PEZI
MKRLKLPGLDDAALGQGVDRPETTWAPTHMKRDNILRCFFANQGGSRAVGSKLVGIPGASHSALFHGHQAPRGLSLWGPRAVPKSTGAHFPPARLVLGIKQPKVKGRGLRKQNGNPS